MPWFKVDDSFHAHPKVLATDPDALGLWVVAGAWSSAHLQDGYVPDHVLPRLLPDSATLAKKLVTAGLWRKERGGYRFHDWSDYNPAAEVVQTEREAARQRMRALRARRKQQGDAQASDSSPRPERDLENETRKPREGAGFGLRDGPKTRTSAGHNPDGSGEQAANVRDMFVTPARPDPAPKGGTPGGSLTPRARDAPPPRCPEHINNPDPPPCGRCADARRALQQWEADDAQRRRDTPSCRRHRGQPAGNCALCRSETIGAEP